jgi:hypothetical protein
VQQQRMLIAPEFCARFKLVFGTELDVKHQKPDKVMDELLSS